MKQQLLFPCAAPTACVYTSRSSRRKKDKKRIFGLFIQLFKYAKHFTGRPGRCWWAIERLSSSECPWKRSSVAAGFIWLRIDRRSSINYERDEYSGGRSQCSSDDERRILRVRITLCSRRRRRRRFSTASVSSKKNNPEGFFFPVQSHKRSGSFQRGEKKTWREVKKNGEWVPVNVNIHGRLIERH